MMKKRTAALYGAGNKSLAAEDILRRHAPDVAVAYLVENRDFSKLGRTLSPLSGGPPLRVISLSALKRLYDAGECDAVLVPGAYHLFDLREIRDNLRKAGIAAKDVFLIPFNRLRAEAEWAAPGLVSLPPFDEAVFLHQLDIHVVDHCNLSCKACAHFSNCVDEPVEYDAALLRKSLEHLQKLVPDVHGISLLGGEPLLHPRLDEILVSSREYFPCASINIVTNGILLERMSPSLLDRLRALRVQIQVSLYPPLQENAGRIAAFLRNFGGDFSIVKIDAFERRLAPRPAFDAQSQFAKCGHVMCLRGSRIGYCVIALFTDYYNRRFAGSGAPPLPEDSGVDVFAHQSGKSLLEALQRPLALCARCVSRDAGGLFREEWEQVGANPRPDDWFISFPFAEAGLIASAKEER